MQGNTQVLKSFAFSVKSPRFKLLVESNFWLTFKRENKLPAKAAHSNLVLIMLVLEVN